MIKFSLKVSTWATLVQFAECSVPAAHQCSSTCELIKGEISSSEACAKSRKSLPRPKIGRVCQVCWGGDELFSQDQMILLPNSSIPVSIARSTSGNQATCQAWRTVDIMLFRPRRRLLLYVWLQGEDSLSWLLMFVSCLTFRLQLV